MSNKSGTSSQAVSLPQGGGAIAAIGETFSADPFTGTGTFTIPLELPEGRSGLTPRLTLAYSAGNGNGPFGLGWDISVPGVHRKTAKGVPRYRDGDPDAAPDTFILSGHEDLVPIGEPAPGTTRFRPRSEGTFARIDHARDGAGDIWRVTGRDGVVNVYGGPEAVIADSSDPARIFAWKLAHTADASGNQIEYTYLRDRAAWDQLYLQRIRYLDFERGGETRFLVSVNFVYEQRPDPFSEYRSGFEIRTRLRCTRIELRTHAAQDLLARTYELRYLDERVAAGELPSDDLPLNGISLLSLVRTIGHDGPATEQLAPFEFGYTPYRPQEQHFAALDTAAGGGQMPPRSLADTDIESVSLFNNGLTDLVEIGATARFWRNLGGGRYDPPRPLSELPANVRLADPGTQLADMTGNGRADLLVLDANGYFPMSFLGRWSATDFVRYEDAPSLTFDGELRMVDIDGDGVIDALRTGVDFELFHNDPAHGWQPPELVPRRPLDEFPDVSFSDHRVKLGDMTGDGLQDIIVVDQGRIDYWPYMGHGRWAPRVTMPAGPSFGDGSFQSFDPRRVLVGDLDGDGVDDLAYVEPDRLTVWINQGGRGWSAPLHIDGTPPFPDADAVRIADPLGAGFHGVLWTTDEVAGGAAHYRFLELTGGRKPYLLTSVDNHRGATTRIEHVSSTEFYLADLDDPKTRWKTPLPCPVQVVKRVETIDALSRGKLTTEYRYHHGYWDGREREFRGFGLVDRFDTERFEDFNAPGLHGNDIEFEHVEDEGFSPPTLTRSWFHLGDVGDEFQERTEADRADEYWPGDPSLLERPPDTERLLAGLTGDAKALALRCMRGSVLRTELYALDGSARSDRPFTVTERQMGLREEDPPAAAELRERIFFAHEVARRTTEWERGEQPRTVVVFTTDHDHFGQPTRTVSIAVPRGRDPRARLAAPPPEPYLATCTLTEYARSDLARGYMVDRVARLTTFEVLDDGRPSAAELRDAVTAADPGDRDLLRVIEHVRTFYDGAPEVGLPLGRLGEHGLQTRAEALAFTDAFLADVVGVRPPYLDATPAWTDDYPVEFRALVPALAGYVRYGEGEIAGSPGGYYVTTRRLRYDFHAGDGPARGLVVAARDARGALARLKYDGFGCCVIRETDAAGLVRELTHDYRVLRPRTETDPNGTLTRVAYSPLGLVRAQHTSGKDGAGDAAEPSVRVDYDLLAFQQRRQPISARTIRRVRHDSDPDVAPDERDATIQTVDYTDGFGRLLQSRTQAEDVQFGDERSGAGVIDEDQGQPVTATAGTPRPAGAPDRVIVSGWQRYDNKGRVIARFEPFRSEGWEFAEPVQAELGGQTTMTFDALGRGVRAVGPDGSEHRVVHGVPVDLARPDSFDPTPWETYTYDPNDNAGRTHPDTSAAYRTHWNTPSSVETDALGRAVATVARNGPDPDDRHVTETAYDIRGNVVAITDALGRRAFTYRHDLAGRRWRSESIDAGRIDTVPGALDETIESRDARGALSLAALDVLQRPIRTWARDGATAPVTLRQRIDYGDGGAAAQPATTRAAARERNQLGRPVASYDEAGLVTLERYDFNGRVTESTRRVIADAPILAVYERAAAAGWKIAPFTVDWAPRPGQSQAEREAELLEATEYRTATRFDALGRIVEQLLPEDVTGRRRVLRPAYDPESRLSGVTLDGEPVIERIAYDARGRRTLIAYGGGVMTRCAYDLSTLLLARVRSERYTKPDELTYRPASPALQDLGYDHDLIGNVLAIHDRTPGSGIPGNPDAFGAADPALGELLVRGEALERRFGYDAVYRLVSATGRECDTPPDAPWWIGAPRCADLTRVRAYTEGYHYDRAGNLLQLTHHNGSGGSRTAFEHGANDNRLQRVGNGSPVDYEFDAAGNLRAETSSRHFEWNHANRLKAFGTQTAGAEPSVHAHYLYDPTGARVKKLVRKQGGRFEVTHYVGAALEHQRWDGGGQPGENNRIHIMDGERRIATFRAGDAHPDDPGPPAQLHLADRVGSSNVVVDFAGGGFVNREEFTPYGTTSFGSFARKRFRFAGRERDEESGLAYHGARYYAAGLARWVSADPAAPRAGLNGYTYANCSPLSLVDPTGLQPEAVATDEKDEQGNIIYELPEQVIEISGTAAPRTLEQAGRNGLIEYQTFDQYDRQLRRDAAEAGDYSWLRGPPDEWYATEYPEEARQEAQERWATYSRSRYSGYLAKKTGEWQSATHRMDNAANVAEAGLVVEALGVAAAVATPVMAAAAEAGTPAITALGTKAMNSAAVMTGASFLYGLAMPPGSPDIPFLVGDDAGRAARPMLSRFSSWFSRRGGSPVPDHIREAALTVLRALNARLRCSAVWRGRNALLPRDVFTDPITSNTVKGLISTVTKLSGPGDLYIEGDEAQVAWDVLLQWAK